MGKVIDITDKLNFEDKPILRIKDKDITVNDEAVNVLQLMQLLGSDMENPENISKACNLLFSEKDMKTIQKMGLNFRSFGTVIQEAMSLVTGVDVDVEGKEPGEE